MFLTAASPRWIRQQFGDVFAQELQVGPFLEGLHLRLRHAGKAPPSDALVQLDAFQQVAT
jgi:hypothetical protein